MNNTYCDKMNDVFLGFMTKMNINCVKLCTRWWISDGLVGVKMATALSETIFL